MFKILKVSCSKLVRNYSQINGRISYSSHKELPFNDLFRNLTDIKVICRSFTTSNASISSVATPIALEDKREFMSVFPDVVRDLTDKVKEFDQVDASVWLEKALHYNVPRGKKNRGLATVLAYKTLCESSKLNSNNIKLANYLGWCVEILQAMFLIADDIMDGSETRRGDLCWYKLKNVNLIAINDSIMIENGLYQILKKHFHDQPYYIDLMDLFHEAAFITTIGQSLDLQTALLHVNQFSMERYKTVVTLKTAYYTFYLPVAIAMHMAGFNNPKLLDDTKRILLEIGEFFQIQDDYIDCYGDPSVSGKIGTDIQDNKCSWLAVKCLEHATIEQKQIMVDNYGQDDEEKIQVVKQLYDNIGIPAIYEQYERESYEVIRNKIDQLPDTIPHTIFVRILDKIYRRES